jgi:23S rRNA pseudouridine2605 synthase
VLARRNQHPKFIDQVLLNPYFSQAGAKVTKVYRAQIKGLVDAERLNNIQKIEIPTKNEILVEVRVESVRVLSFSEPEKKSASSCVEIEINEGIHHQVKKMFYALGHPVRKGGLHRTRFGELTLAADSGGVFREMSAGEIRPLLDAEKKWLVNLYNDWLTREKQSLKPA